MGRIETKRRRYDFSAAPGDNPDFPRRLEKRNGIVDKGWLP